MIGYALASTRPLHAGPLRQNAPGDRCPRLRLLSPDGPLDTCCGGSHARSLAGDEQVLIARVLAREPAAERAFYDAHVDRVYRLAVRIVRDPEVARDLTQDTFLRVFERLGQFRGEACLATWVRQVALSVILNGRKQTALRRTREVVWDEWREEAHEPATAPVEASQFELRDRLAAAVAALPVSLRTVVLLYDVEGYHHREIATALGISESTSKIRLCRARAQLRLALADLAVAWAE